MITEADLLEFESERWKAILARDVSKLDGMLSEDLCYTHTTGLRDTKASYLDSIPRGVVRDIRRTNETATIIDCIGVIQGDARLSVTRPNGEQTLEISYTAVWAHVSQKLLAWHSSIRTR
jgi:hypothetical protein